MASPRVIVVYAVAGIGHKRAAEAVANALRERQVPYALVDVLDYMPGWLRHWYPRLYMLCVTKIRWLWGLLYAATNIGWLDALTGGLRRWLNYRMATSFVRWVQDTGAATVVSTHFLPAEILSVAKQRGHVTAQSWAVLTDYKPHQFWLTPRTDRYCVGLADSQALLEQLGVLRKYITVSGIPVDPIFEQPVDVATIRASYQLEQDRLTLLLVSGGAGIGPVEQIVRAFLSAPQELQRHVQLVVVAGDNPPLQSRLTALAQQSAFPLHVLGFTKAMHEVIGMSDIVITKPGGLSVTESLVAGKPLVLFAPIWGQETGNAEVLVRMGVARRMHCPADIVTLVQRWVRQPQMFREVQALCRSAVPSGAAHTIAEACA